MKQWINATSSLLPLAHIAVQLWKHLSDTEIERRISAEISDQESHCSFEYVEGYSVICLCSRGSKPRSRRKRALGEWRRRR